MLYTYFLFQSLQHPCEIETSIIAIFTTEETAPEEGNLLGLEPNFLTLKFTIFSFKFIYFIFREKGREKKRERNISVWLPLMCPPTGDLAHNPGMCPRLGIEPATLWFAGQHSIH